MTRLPAKLRSFLWVMVLTGLIVGSQSGAQAGSAPRIPGGVPGPGGGVQQPTPVRTPPTRMPQNPSLDRRIQRARELLAKGDHQGGLEVLHGVLAESSGPLGEGQDPPAGALPGVDGAMFTADGRLFRPVRSLCEEILAGLGPGAREVLEGQYGIAARSDWEAVARERSPAVFAPLSDRWFGTIAGAKLLHRGALLAMDSGDFTSASQALLRLLDVLPREVLRDAALDVAALQLRLALAWTLLGDGERALERLARLESELGPDTTVELLGKAVRAGDLKSHPLFAALSVAAAGRSVGASGGRGPGAPPAGSAGNGSHLVTAAGQTPLSPLWVYRFADPNPYRVTRSGGRRATRPVPWRTQGTGRMPLSLAAAIPGTRINVLSAQHGPFAEVAAAATVSPRPGSPGAGESAGLPWDRLVIRDHNRVRVLDAWTGMLVQESTGALQPPEPLGRGPRQRTPIYDHGTHQVVFGAGQWCTVLGAPSGHPLGAAALLANRLVAFTAPDPMTQRLKVAWQYPPDEVAMAVEPSGPVPLATPTLTSRGWVFPTLDGSHLGVACVGEEDGRLLWHTRLHTGGSSFVRPPATQVILASGRLFALTHAGVVAALHPDTGALHWARRYEREGPGADGPKRNSNGSRRGRNDVPVGFVPTPPRVVAGRLIVAPSDGLAVLALEPATGELVWSLDARSGEVSRSARPLYPIIDHLLGSTTDALMFQAGRGVLCVEARTGRRRWFQPQPPGLPGHWWSGRGCVSGDQLVIPGPDRTLRVLRMDAGGQALGHWQVVRIPNPTPGTAPLQGPCNVRLTAGQLILGFGAGIECHAIGDAWWQTAAAAEPSRQVDFLVDRLLLAGRLEDAFECLAARIETGSSDGDESVGSRRKWAKRTVSVARDIALAAAVTGDREAALRPLVRATRMLERVPAPEMDQRLLLAEVETLEALGDVEGAAAAKNRLRVLLMDPGAGR